MFIWLLQSKVRSLLEKLEKLVDKNCWRPDKQPGGGGWEGKFKKEVLDNWFGRQGGVKSDKTQVNHQLLGNIKVFDKNKDFVSKVQLIVGWFHGLPPFPLHLH